MAPLSMRIRGESASASARDSRPAAAGGPGHRHAGRLPGAAGVAVCAPCSVCCAACRSCASRMPRHLVEELERKDDGDRKGDRDDQVALVAHDSGKLLKATAVSFRGGPAAPGRSRGRPRGGSADAPQGQAEPRTGPVPAQRLDSVFRAGWAVAAIAAEHGRDQPAIAGHQDDQQPRRQAHRSRRRAIWPNAPARSDCRLRERKGQRRRPRDHDIVRGRPRRAGQDQPQRLAQAPTGAIARHGVADLAGDGEADADGAGALGLGSRQRLQHERRPAQPRPAGRGQELAAAPQSHDRYLGRGSCPLKRTGACVHGHGGRRSPSGRQRWPCGRESRADVCERACSADTCASQRNLRCRE